MGKLVPKDEVACEAHCQTDSNVHWTVEPLVERKECHQGEVDQLGHDGALDGKRGSKVGP